MRYTSTYNCGQKRLFLNRLCNDIYWGIKQNGVGYSVTGDAIDKFADYEDAEEQGLLLKLPCKTVWHIVDKGTKYATVMGKDISRLAIYEINGIDKKGYYYSTKEAAEQALAKMKEVQNG